MIHDPTTMTIPMSLRLLSILTLLCIPLTLAADSKVLDNQAKASSYHQPTIRFASSSVEPWGIHEGKEKQGLLVSVINALALETAIAVNIELQPYPRVVHSLYSGRADFAFLFDSPSTRESAIRIGHLVNSRMIVVGRAGSPPLNSLKELEGKSVGLIRGSKYGIEFDNATHFHKEPVSSMSQGLAMLIRNRTDAMAGTDQSVYWAMRKMNVGAKRLSKLYVMGGTSGSLYISKTSEYQHLIPVYKKALETLHHNGTIKRIFDSRYEWANTKDKEPLTQLQ
jgi:polar amino acid transport system substrate-binding protein